MKSTWPSANETEFRERMRQSAARTKTQAWPKMQIPDMIMAMRELAQRMDEIVALLKHQHGIEFTVTERDEHGKIKSFKAG